MIRRILAMLVIFAAMLIAGCSFSASPTTSDCPVIFESDTKNSARDYQRYEKHAKSLRKIRHGYRGTISGYSKAKRKKSKMRTTVRGY